MGEAPRKMKLVFVFGILTLALAAAWEEAATTQVAEITDAPHEVRMAQMLAESQDYASKDEDSRSGAGTEIQRAIKGYAGTFLEHLDKLPGDQAMSGSKVTALLQSYMSAPHKLTGVLAEMRELVPANERATFELLAGGLDAEKLAENVVDRLPHDGDKLLMGDHSSCGEQSVDDLFADIFEQNPRPELEYALESADKPTIQQKDDEWPADDAEW